MTPTEAKADLRAMLDDFGETVVLKRRVGSTTGFDQVTLQGFVRGFRPDELIGGITQQDSKVICGTEEIVAAGWPQTAGGFAWPRNGDFAVIGGSQRGVVAATPIRVNDEVVRIEMVVKG